MITMHPSPLGPVRFRVEDAHVVEILVAPTDDHGDVAAIDAGTLADRRVTAEARRQLDGYFAGRRRDFDLPLAPRGTAFQRQVWDALLRIPSGVTRSYGEIARAIGRPTASRAVGAANGQNRIWIVVPCHRVIGRTGALTGYAGGLDRKAWLLAHEARLAA